MKAKTLSICALLCAFIVVSAPCAVFAQDAGAPVTVTFSEQELDQMLAPIALYPDSLLAQILIAATYPDQVMDADQWVHAHPGLKGEELNGALDRMDWDLSIKALVPFPEVLDMMAQEPDWTQRLGEAFLAQQAAVMDSVQRLRRKAEAAGNLQSTPQQRVVTTDDYVQIEPVDPEIVYIPRYNPLVVYGTWWWPAYPPFAYYPVWSGPPVAFAPVVGVFGFWGGIAVGPAWGWGWGSWGWGSRTVFLNVDRRININTRNAAVIHRWHRNFRIASAHNMAVAGRFGSSTVRMRAFGTRAGNPAALRGHVFSARVSHGRVMTPSGARLSTARTRQLPSGLAARTPVVRNGARGGHTGAGSARPTLNGHSFGRTPPGSRSGFGGQGSHGRPSANQVMRELRGGKIGASGARSSGGRTGSYGNSRARGSLGQTRSNHSFGQSRSNRSFGQTRSNRSFGQTRSNRSFGQTRHNAARGGSGGFTHGAARGGRQGGYGGAPHGASHGGQHGGGHNDRRR